MAERKVPDEPEVVGSASQEAADTGAALAEAGRSALTGALAAPAIIRSADEMRVADAVSAGLDRYLGPKGALAFYGFVKPDGTPKSGDAPLPTVDKVLGAFDPEAIKGAVQGMKNDPRIVIGPDFGDARHNFTAQVAAMNGHKTVQDDNAFVDPGLGSSNASGLSGLPIVGYRPTLIDGAIGPKPYFHDDTSRPYPDRLATHQAFLAGKPFGGTDRLAYADLMALSLFEKSPVDAPPQDSVFAWVVSQLSRQPARGSADWTWTIFDKDAPRYLGHALAPMGCYYDGQPDFRLAGVQAAQQTHNIFRCALPGSVLR